MMFHKLFPMKIHAICFEIAHKTMALPILKITCLVCHALGKSIDEKPKFSWSHPSK